MGFKLVLFVAVAFLAQPSFGGDTCAVFPTVYPFFSTSGEPSPSPTCSCPRGYSWVSQSYGRACKGQDGQMPSAANVQQAPAASLVNMPAVGMAAANLAQAQSSLANSNSQLATANANLAKAEKNLAAASTYVAYLNGIYWRSPTREVAVGKGVASIAAATVEVSNAQQAVAAATESVKHATNEVVLANMVLETARVAQTPAVKPVPLAVNRPTSYSMPRASAPQPVQQREPASTVDDGLGFTAIPSESTQ